MNSPITITQEQLQKAKEYITSLEWSSHFKHRINHAFDILCGCEHKIYYPGNIVIISGPGINGEEPHIMCVTADATCYRGVRFCSTTTGRKAGSNFKPYQLPYDVSGVTANQIEEYLGSGYTVIEKN